MNMKILFAGDLCPRFRGDDLLTSMESIEESFASIQPIIREADYSFVNLECPVVNKDAKPIIKMGPNLKSDEKVGDLIDYLGFRCVTLANNHIMDYGKAGLIDTLDFCKKRGYDYTGVGLNEHDAFKVLYKRIKDTKIAVINCCEQEFSIADGDKAGAAHLDAVTVFRLINEAKKNSDYVIVIVHGGHEHWQLPSPRMIDTYRFFIDVGASVVVNHHQHCYSGFERYNHGLIFYGLGNFFFDSNPLQEKSLWNYGYLVTVSFDKEISFEIIPYSQCDKECKITLLAENSFSDKLQEINSLIADRKSLREATDNYYSNESRECALAFEPIQNRYFLGLQFRKLIPLFKTKKGLLRIYNFVLCESHRDKVKWYLTHKIDNQ